MRKTRTNTRRLFLMDEEEFNAIAQSQNFRCAICGRQVSLLVDHDHKRHTLRSLLCAGCNSGLGQFRDSPEALRAAADYIEKWEANPSNRQILTGEERIQRRQELLQKKWSPENRKKFSDKIRAIHEKHRSEGRIPGRPNTSSGVEGVTREGNKWVVRIGSRSAGTRLYLGKFDTVEEAITVRRAAEDFESETS